LEKRISRKELVTGTRESEVNARVSKERGGESFGLRERDCLEEDSRLKRRARVTNAKVRRERRVPRRRRKIANFPVCAERKGERDQTATDGGPGKLSGEGKEAITVLLNRGGRRRIH